MKKIIEAIPNFSVCKELDINTFNKLKNVVHSHKGVKLISAHSDVNHNRSVFTIVGTIDDVEKTTFDLVKCAVQNIDMNKHHGEHSRIGACDVLPFVPLVNTNIEECIGISKKIAARAWEELAYPSFLYEASASCDARKNLANIRKGQWEGMNTKLLEPQWKPDFGDRKMHPTAGIMAIGARKPLIAYNINLKTNDVEIAKSIARKIRESNGGFKDVKAMGVMLYDKDLAQVSMNMCDYTTTGLHTVFNEVSKLAKEFGTEVLESELVGSIPAKALADITKHYLKINNFDIDSQILEYDLI